VTTAVIVPSIFISILRRDGRAVAGVILPLFCNVVQNFN
jgi:hypothetical protein